jgi:adenosylcobinamide-GDP ribazoletransferase
MSKFINALGFLTIIRIPGKYILKTKQISSSTVYFPVVGLIIGSLMALFYFAISFILPVFLSIILMLILEVFLTGGAHLDGLADMFDGAFSGKSDKNKIIEIMRKSDIGVYGILVVVFLVLLKISLLYYLAKINPAYLPIFFIAVVFMPSFGRWSMVYLIARYRNAGGNASLARVFTDSGDRRKNLYISSIYMTLLFLISFVFLEYYCAGGKMYCAIFASRFEGIYLVLFILIKALLVIAVLFLLLYLIGWFFTRRIRGITGDIIGGISEIVELMFLFIILLIFNFL